MITAQAHPNIALIKYWGKSDEDLIIPVTGSVALTLDVFPTTTSVELLESAQKDTATLNGTPLTGVELARVSSFLEHIRTVAGRNEFAHVTSENTVPTAAGLASSSSGFAALAVAAAYAYELQLDARAISRIARRGSGSACRSIFSGVSRWNAGEDDESSFAEPLDWRGDDLAMILAVVSTERKAVSSRVGMQETARTSPYFDGWIQSNRELVEEASAAVAAGDFTRLGELTELSTLRMHAVMMASEPPIRYMNGLSFSLFDQVLELRQAGLESYATADAGPNVKILCRERDAVEIQGRLQTEFEAVDFVVSRSGPGATVIN